MPGRLAIETPLADLAARYGARFEGEEPGPRLDAAPGEILAVLTAEQTLIDMRWGMVMTGRVNARKRPVMETIINVRSETVFTKSAYEGVTRAAVPVDAWYEWTGKVRKKTRWRIRAVDGTPMAFAAVADLWSGPGGVALWQVATLTAEPNADVREYHHRMPVILPRGALADWLGGADIPLEPAPDGSLVVEKSALP